MTRPKTLAALICSAFAVSALPSMAAASPKPDVKTVEVSIAKYDLATPEDAQVVYDRIKRAAKRACRRSVAQKTPSEHIEERNCRDQAIEQAVTQLDEPYLTLVMNGQNPSS